MAWAAAAEKDDKNEEPPHMSEPIPKGPFKPGELVQVVADNVEEVSRSCQRVGSPWKPFCQVVYREDKDTLLELYARKLACWTTRL